MQNFLFSFAGFSFTTYYTHEKGALEITKVHVTGQSITWGKIRKNGKGEKAYYLKNTQLSHADFESGKKWREFFIPATATGDSPEELSHWNEGLQTKPMFVCYPPAQRFSQHPNLESLKEKVTEIAKFFVEGGKNPFEKEQTMARATMLKTIEEKTTKIRKEFS